MPILVINDEFIVIAILFQTNCAMFDFLIIDTLITFYGMKIGPDFIPLNLFNFELQGRCLCLITYMSYR